MTPLEISDQAWLNMTGASTTIIPFPSISFDFARVVAGTLEVVEPKAKRPSTELPSYLGQPRCAVGHALVRVRGAKDRASSNMRPINWNPIRQRLPANPHGC
jgi:hypothetical protein